MTGSKADGIGSVLSGSAFDSASGKCFIDSNIWLYFFAKDDREKQRAAEQFITEHLPTAAAVVSWQVINEVWRNLLRKGVRDDVACSMIEFILASCPVVDFSQAMLLAAHGLRSRHSVSYWDSLIIAAALEAGCNTLASEDMQNGQRFGSLRVRNVFR